MPTFLTFLLRPFIFFIVTVVLFSLERWVFIMFYPEIFGDLSAGDKISAMLHGIPMDCSMAGYLSIIPLVISMIAVWFPEKNYTSRYELATTGATVVEVGSSTRIHFKTTIRCLLIAYYIIVSLAIGIISTLDMELYPIWGFRLDINPFYYFNSSASAVIGGLSSSQLWGGVVGVLSIAILCFSAYFFSCYFITYVPQKTLRMRIYTFLMLILMGGIDFCVIRGSVFTVSTMNISRAYFSPYRRLNHIAINPMFSVLYTALHQNDFTDKYNFYPKTRLPELISIVSPLSNLPEEERWQGADSIVSSSRPDIYLIILESFSSHLFPSLGGEPIATELDKIASEGLLFTNGYATSFRTDRALPAILNAFPGLPEKGITKEVQHIEHLPSIGSALYDIGYDTEYYYGGDLNFTNMKALLVAGGFKKIIGDQDFALSERLGKWGAHDDVLFRKVMDMAPKGEAVHRKPVLRVIQTSSSHEPFEVPYNKLADKRANAFAFTDSVVGKFVRDLEQKPEWKNTLVVIVPDHYGAYPDPNSLSMKERHQIPIIFTGGALKKKGVFEEPTAQTSIVPSILALVGVPHDRFFFGRNIFDPRETKMIYFYDRDYAVMSSDQGISRVNIDTMEVEILKSDSTAAPITVLSPLNPKVQLKGWMQAISSYYNLRRPYHDPQ